MQIDDTFVVTAGGELTAKAGQTTEQFNAELQAMVRDLVLQACQTCRAQRPGYRTLALSVTPLLYEYNGRRNLLLTTIVALVPQPLDKAFFDSLATPRRSS